MIWTLVKLYQRSTGWKMKTTFSYSALISWNLKQIRLVNCCSSLVQPPWPSLMIAYAFVYCTQHWQLCMMMTFENRLIDKGQLLLLSRAGAPLYRAQSRRHCDVDKEVELKLVLPQQPISRKHHGQAAALAIPQVALWTGCSHLKVGLWSGTAGTA